jgi:hypothetical protein
MRCLGGVGWGCATGWQAFASPEWGLCLCRGGVRGNSNDRVASLVGIYTQHDHHGSQLLSLVTGVVRTGRWARLSAGLEVNLLSSHAGRSGAPNEWQNTQQATPLAGTAMENQPIRHHQHDTEPLWAATQLWLLGSLTARNHVDTLLVGSIELSVVLVELRELP